MNDSAQKKGSHMSTNFVFEQPEHRPWVLFHQTCNATSSCEERTFTSDSLTYPQMAVMMAIKHTEIPVTPTAVARWLNRSTNSITTGSCLLYSQPVLGYTAY